MNWRKAKRIYKVNTIKSLVNMGFTKKTAKIKAGRLFRIYKDLMIWNKENNSYVLSKIKRID